MLKPVHAHMLLVIEYSYVSDSDLCINVIQNKLIWCFTLISTQMLAKVEPVQF